MQLPPGFEITFRKYVKFCMLFFVGEMFWSGYRPNNSDVNHSLYRRGDDCETH